MNATQTEQASFRFSPGRAADPDGDSRRSGRPSPDARHGIDFYRECECARRAGGEYAALGTRRTADVRFSHWRVSLLGPGSILPTIARRRLRNRSGVPGTERAMGCLIPKIA